MPPKKRTKLRATSETETRLVQLNIDIYAAIAQHASLGALICFSLASKATRLACLPLLFSNASFDPQSSRTVRDLCNARSVLPHLRTVWIDIPAIQCDIDLIKLLSLATNLLNVGVGLSPEYYPCSQFIPALFKAMTEHIPRARLFFSVCDFAFDPSEESTPMIPFDSFSNSNIITRSTHKAHPADNDFRNILNCLWRNSSLLAGLLLKRCKLGPGKNLEPKVLQPGLRNLASASFPELHLDDWTVQSLRGGNQWPGEVAAQEMYLEYSYSDLPPVLSLASLTRSTLRILRIDAKDGPTTWEADMALELDLDFPCLTSLTIDTYTATAILPSARLPKLQTLVVEGGCTSGRVRCLFSLCNHIILADLPVLKNITLVGSMPVAGTNSLYDPVAMSAFESFQEECENRGITSLFGVSVHGDTSQSNALPDVLAGLSMAEKLVLKRIGYSGEWYTGSPIRMEQVRYLEIGLEDRLDYLRRGADYLNLRGPFQAIVAPNVQELVLYAGKICPRYLAELAELLAGERSSYSSLKSVQGHLYLVLHEDEAEDMSDVEVAAKVAQLARRFRRCLQARDIAFWGLDLFDATRRKPHPTRL